MRGTSNHGVFLLQLIFVFIFAIGNVAGQLKFTNPSLDGLTAGAPFNLTWTGAAGTTTLTLQNGTASNRNTVDTVAFGIQGEFIEWTPWATTPPGLYVLRLDDTSGNSAYSNEFTMLATGTKTSATRGLQFSNPSLDGLTAGSPFNLTWSGASGTTTLTLQNGTADNMDVVATIASGIQDEFLVWTPYADTPLTQYVLHLEDTAGDACFSALFTMRSALSGSISSSPSSTSTSSQGPKQKTTSSSEPTSSNPTSNPTSTSTSDSTSPTSSTNSASTTGTESPATSHSTSAGLTSTSAPPSETPSLSTAAKAGIGIGSSLAGICFIGILIMVCTGRRKKWNLSSKQRAVEADSRPIGFGSSRGLVGEGAGGETQEMPSYMQDSRLVREKKPRRPAEVEGYYVHELDAR